MYFTLLQTACILFVGSILVAFTVIPRLNAIVRYKHLLDTPNHRSSHTEATSNLGGIAFYIAVMMGFYFMAPFDRGNIIISLIPGLTIIFILGLKDDLVVLSPLTKLLGQIFAAMFLVFHFQFSIESLHGFMGIENMNVYVATPLAILIIVSVMNAINLIDGIDGLAASISWIIFGMFGYVFYLTGHHFLLLLCLAMIGVLSGFLFFNLNTKPNKKTFMGDTGSMILGFLIGALAIRFLALDNQALSTLPMNPENLPIIVLAILIVPFFDTVRVFFLRIIKGNSPFKPDRNHIHHIIVDRFQISHRRASFCIGMAHFLFVIGFGALAVNTTQVYLIITFSVFVLLSVLFFFFLSNSQYSRWIKKKIKKHLYLFKKEKVNTASN
jgi:UDP-N-acetylmuramyl pentapeptide phosphotransferase/UDP-N-acetylglucosamine-1-phosphate transferase